MFNAGRSLITFPLTTFSNKPKSNASFIILGIDLLIQYLTSTLSSISFILEIFYFLDPNDVFFTSSNKLGSFSNMYLAPAVATDWVKMLIHVRPFQRLEIYFLKIVAPKGRLSKDFATVIMSGDKL